MKKSKKTIEFYEPGNYELTITRVTATNNAICIHFDELHECFDLTFDLKAVHLARAVSKILGIRTGEFAKRYDSKEISEVAEKLAEDLVGKIARVEIVGTSAVYSLIRKEPKLTIATKILIRGGVKR
jgi:hypothetical protein